MSDDKQKPGVLNELEGLKNFLGSAKDFVTRSSNNNAFVEIPELDQEIPELNQEIPTLDQTIPILDEPVDLLPNIKVTLDPAHSTETVEQQLIRTRHEQPANSPELVSNDPPELDEVINEKEQQFSQKLEIVAEVTNNTSSTNEFFEVPTAEENQLDSELDRQQQEIENQHSDSTELELTPQYSQSGIPIEQQLLDASWEKVEMLLMDNLPPQISGAFLTLLNNSIEENKLHLMSELSLLDEISVRELANKLNLNHQ